MSSKGNAPTSQFLNGTNYQKIVGFLREQYAKKSGSAAISKRMEERLQKTVQHYMTEVARLQPGKPASSLTQEVLRETTLSMDTWLKRQEAPAPPTTTSAGAFTRPDEYNRLFEDTGSRYESLMAERAPPAPALASIPDFRQPQDTLESDEDPVLLMQRMQKQREAQSRMLGLAGPPPVATPPNLIIKEEVTPSATHPIPPQADAPPALLAPRPQDYIIPQEDIVKYRETELNLFITSADRDWFRNTTENRYNFTVNFNTGSKKIGYGYNTAIQTRLRNIQRIEFVKAIVPIESLTQIVRVIRSKNGDDPAAYDTGRVVNVFSLPFLGIRIDELEPNGYSTKPDEDATFAIVQYDTTWSSDLYAPHMIMNGGRIPDNNVCAKSGYTGLIPKFLKTQRVYTPTPLATLQKLSISMQRHNGTLLSTDSDVWSVANVCLSDCTSPAIGTDCGCSAYTATDISNSYIFVETSKYFPHSAISEGDHIQFQGYNPQTSSSAASDFSNYINRSEGHYVVAIGYVDINSGALPHDIKNGRNNAGYCNIIMLRSRFDDPSTGHVTRNASYYGGSKVAEDTLAAALCNESVQSGAALINLSRQTHVVLRVVTRDMDSGANIRPDNV